jgi:hypothetical protein
MEPYQQRVIDEEKELTDKLVKLDAFLLSPTFLMLPEVEKESMRKQSYYMMRYAQMLKERIARFKI